MNKHTELIKVLRIEATQHAYYVREMFLKAADALQASESAAAPQLPVPEGAMQRYKKLMVEGEEPDPVERLRFFCSLAMNGDDWFDVEQFFDAIKAQPPASAAIPAAEKWAMYFTGYPEQPDYAPGFMKDCNLYDSETHVLIDCKIHNTRYSNQDHATPGHLPYTGRKVLVYLAEDMQSVSAAVPEGRFRGVLEGLVDIWNDQNNSPENRAYVEGAFEAQFDEAKAMLAATPQPPVPAKPLPEWDNTTPNSKQGLYQKFVVQRVDGSDAPKGKHHRCEYFVLDVTHDAHAPAALMAYAASCADTHPKLSADLIARWGVQPVSAKPLPLTNEQIGKLCPYRVLSNNANVWKNGFHAAHNITQEKQP